MTPEELHELRRQRRPALAPDGLPAFVAAAGYALAAPDPAWDLPAFAAARPDAAPGQPEAEPHWIAELEAAIASRTVCEVQAFGPAVVYMPPELLADAFVWAGGSLPADRRDRAATGARPAQPPALPHLSPLATHVAGLLWASPPLTASQLRDAVGPQRTSILAILAAARELARQLQIVRVGGSPADPLWSPVSAAFPQVREALAHAPRDRALAALVSKYLWLMAAADEPELFTFFGHLVSRSRLQSLMHGLATAGAVTTTEIAGRPAFQLSR